MDVALVKIKDIAAICDFHVFDDEDSPDSQVIAFRRRVAAGAAVEPTG